MNMIPALVVIYILLIGLAMGGSFWSLRLRQRYGLSFLRTYHIFVLLSFAYAVANFIGEVFAPAILARPAESMIGIYLIVDLVTIPLLGCLFFLLFLWITRLLGRRVPPALKAVFGVSKPSSWPFSSHRSSRTSSADLDLVLCGDLHPQRDSRDLAYRGRPSPPLRLSGRR